MPAKTPRAAGVRPKKGMKFIADAIGDNVRAYRLLSELEQDDIAGHMQRLGWPWRRATVSAVERGRRNITVPELLTLGLILGVTVQELLDPRRPDQRDGDGMIVMALNPDMVGMPIISTHVTGLVCRHELDIQPIEFPADDALAISFRHVAPAGDES
jgi:transcriptional regulator with XRE-family HTH domain